MEPFLQSPLTELSFQPAFLLLPWSYQTTCARHGTTNGSLQFMKCQILKPARVFLFQCQSWGVIVASQDRILTEFFSCLIFFAILVQNYPLCTICRLNIVGQVGNATTINNTDFYSFAQQISIKHYKDSFKFASKWEYKDHTFFKLAIIWD